MRIRKRFPPATPPSVPLPSSPPSSSSSSAASLPIPSDPQVMYRSPVLPPPHLLSMVQIPTKSSDNPTPPRLTNQEMIIGSANPRRGFLTSCTITQREIKKKRDEDEETLKDDEQRQEEFVDQMKSNDSRKVAELDTCGIHLGQTFYPYFSSPGVTGRSLGHQVNDEDDDDDHEENVVVPLKKRKDMSFDQSNIINMKRDLETYSNNKKEDIDPKCEMNKCLVMPQKNVPLINPDIHHYQEARVVDNYNGNTSKSTKAKKVRGSKTMEGSRCSRVNGRGWRCWQQTLVGYSSCEHHLGKGRLRSTSTMISSSNRVRISNNEAAIAPTPLSSRLIRGEVEKALEISNHRDDDHQEVGMKMGHGHVVKARSISSLLGKTTNNNVDSKVVTSSSTLLIDY